MVGAEAPLAKEPARGDGSWWVRVRAGVRVRVGVRVGVGVGVRVRVRVRVGVRVRVAEEPACARRRDSEWCGSTLVRQYITMR